MTNSANRKGEACGIWHNQGYNHEIVYAFESLSTIPYCVVCQNDLTDQELYFIELRNTL